MLNVHFNEKCKVCVIFGTRPEAKNIAPILIELANLLPVIYPDFVHLLNSTWLLASESGGIQEEVPMLREQSLFAIFLQSFRDGIQEVGLRSDEPSESASENVRTLGVLAQHQERLA